MTAMIKSILVPATGSDSDAAAYATAAAVGRLFGGHIDALHVRLDPVEVGVAMTTEGAGGTLLEGIIDSLTQDADAAEAKARAAFAEFCSRDGLTLADAPTDDRKPSAAFHAETGQEARWMSVYGLTADLAIATRGAPGAEAVARSTLEALLLETGRPLLVPGAMAPAQDFADYVAIAWKPTPQAARAVAAAMPFLMRAREVAVLTVDEEDSRRDDAEGLVGYLAWHGIKAALQQVVPGTAGGPGTLLAAAAAKGGLLVMGAYGHTRIREWVFGGFTQWVLDHSVLPVLMAH
jgi:nucleotide-binding universal stress UspA family protein